MFADEFQSDVERFGFDPARLGGEAGDTFDEAGETGADGVVDVERDEEAHKGRC